MGRKTVIYIHVPKTGGTTLKYILRKVYGDKNFRTGLIEMIDPLYDDYINAKTVAELKKMCIYLKNDVDVVAGHIPYLNNKGIKVSE